MAKVIERRAQTQEALHDPFEFLRELTGERPLTTYQNEKHTITLQPNPNYPSYTRLYPQLLEITVQRHQDHKTETYLLTPEDGVVIAIFENPSITGIPLSPIDLNRFISQQDQIHTRHARTTQLANFIQDQIAH